MWAGGKRIHSVSPSMWAPQTLNSTSHKATSMLLGQSPHLGWEIWARWPPRSFHLLNSLLHYSVQTKRPEVCEDEVENHRSRWRWGCWAVGSRRVGRVRHLGLNPLTLLTLSSCLTTLHTDFSNVDPEYQSQPQSGWWVFYECVRVCVQAPAGKQREMSCPKEWCMLLITMQPQHQPCKPHWLPLALEMWERDRPYFGQQIWSENYPAIY